MSKQADQDQNERSLIRKNRPSTKECLRLIDDLKYFLATAPANWQENQVIRRYYLNREEGFVSCVMWEGLYYLTGTDIVRCAIYRFECFGREIVDRKKFEEGIFSDLRALKCGVDAVLEEPKSPFLNFLFKNQCLRTQKKQKVFYWFSIVHDKLFADALERDMKRELSGQVATTRAIAEPALSFVYDQDRSLNEQLAEYVKKQKEHFKISLDDPEKTPVSSIHDSSSSPAPVGEEAEHPPPNKFIITEENNVPVATPGTFDDDFPLDYFPPSTEPVFIDPSVFFNPPETFDDQLLIDQTYAKTPYQESFDFKRGDGITTLVEEAEEDDDSYRGPKEENDNDNIPIAQVPSMYVPHGTIVPSYTVSGHPVQPVPLHYPYQPPYSMTNGQYYDRGVGEAGDLADVPIEYIPVNPSPAYYGYSSMSPSPFPGPQASFPYEGYYQQQQPIPYFVAEQDGDDAGINVQDDDFFNESFERQQFYQQMYHQQQHPGQSPFGRYFPSFEATKPPSSKGPKFPGGTIPLSSKTPKFSHKITKPSTLRNSRKVKKTDGTLKGKGSVKFVEPQQNESEQNESSSFDREPKRNVNNDDDTEDEYNSLPTPESTVAQDNQLKSETS